jgi:hypothetical protein
MSSTVSDPIWNRLQFVSPMTLRTRQPFTGRVKPSELSEPTFTMSSELTFE